MIRYCGGFHWSPIDICASVRILKELQDLVADYSWNLSILVEIQWSPTDVQAFAYIFIEIQSRRRPGHAEDVVRSKRGEWMEKKGGQVRRRECALALEFQKARYLTSSDY